MVTSLEGSAANCKESHFEGKDRTDRVRAFWKKVRSYLTQMVYLLRFFLRSLHPGGMHPNSPSLTNKVKSQILAQKPAIEPIRLYVRARETF